MILIKYRYLLMIFITTLLLSECTSNNVYINRPKEFLEGEHFLDKFYHNIENKYLDSLDVMTSDTLKTQNGGAGVSKIANLVNAKMGFYKKFSISESYTKCLTGAINITYYKYTLKVNYNNGTTEETIGLLKKNAVIKITSYYVNATSIGK